MKYWRGYLVAAIFAAMTWALNRLGSSLSGLVDMVYPYMTRTIESMLAQWSGTVDVCLWQVGAIVLAVWVLLANLPFMVIQRYNRPRLVRLAALLRKREQKKGDTSARTDTDL